MIEPRSSKPFHDLLIILKRYNIQKEEQALKIQNICHPLAIQAILAIF